MLPFSNSCHCTTISCDVESQGEVLMVAGGTGRRTHPLWLPIDMARATSFGTSEDVHLEFLVYYEARNNG